MKNRSVLFRLTLLSGALALGWSGCSLNDPDDGAPGTHTVTATFSISAAGGTVTVDKPGDPLDGMEIMVPAGAYSAPVTFTLSSAPLDAAALPAGFTPASPLVVVDDGSAGYADSLVMVTIPCAVADNEFALAFFCNPATGELEALPLLDYSATSLTLLTRTFAPPRDGGLGRRGAGGLWGIVIGVIDTALLSETASSDFTPGVDDWEYDNRGSYASCEGICSGMSYSALWYHQLVKPADAVPLHDRYDRFHSDAL